MSMDFNPNAAVLKGIVQTILSYINVRIKIDLEPNQLLARGKAWYGKGHVGVIQGSLNRLKANHQLWLLIQQSPGGTVFPQKLEGYVDYDPSTRHWAGQILLPTHWKNVTVTVVSSPRTAQTLFENYLEVGNKTDRWDMGLDSVPPECKIRDSVTVGIERARERQPGYTIKAQ